MSETLMCGLKTAVEFVVPGGAAITRAVDLVERVNSRHEILSMKEVQAKHERELSQFERRMRDMVQEEMTQMVATFRSGGGATGAVLEKEIRNYFAINQHGYAPAMFEGLLRQSPHWEDLRRSPENYGDVLEPGEALNPKKIPVLIEADPLRVLELKPYAFAQLLTGQHAGAGDEGVKVAGAADVWLLRGQSTPAASVPTSAAAPPAPPVVVTPPKKIITPAAPPATSASTESSAPSSITTASGITLARINPGTFLMGSPEDEPERGDDELQHEVTITRPFYLGRTPVLQAEWKAVMGQESPSHFKGTTLPVENVSYDDALAFIDRLSKREGKRFRLPTEAEWEYACRAGTTTPFSFGSTISTKQANFDGKYPYNGGPKEECRKKTTSPKIFAANPWGLFDMHGNVWEWCQDWYGPYSGKKESDPQGPKDGSARVWRGGCWGIWAGGCRSACRMMSVPGRRDYSMGFRVALDSD